MSEFVSRVSVRRCEGYESTRLAAALEQCLSALGPLPLSQGARVLLKPNCLSADHGPDLPVNTRAEVVEAVGRYLKGRYGVALFIADSGGMGSYGKAKRAYGRMGLDRAADRLGAELVNLEELGLIEISHAQGVLLKRFKATALLEQVDFIVNLPKMKTHILTGITGAIKNYLGLLPGSLKRKIHVQAPSGPAMAQALTDVAGGIHRKVPAVLHLMDGIVSMEGMGPTHGHSRKSKLLLASLDPVALDTVAATAMGFHPSRLPLLVLSGIAGLGISDPEGIDLQGSEWKDLYLPGFKHPFSRFREWAERVIPSKWLGRAYDLLYEAKPRIKEEACQGCRACILACPAGALAMTDVRLNLNKALCIECYCCLEHCPTGALSVPRGLRERWRLKKAS